MEPEPNVVGQIAPPEVPADVATTDKTPKAKLAKSLPSERISFDKQTTLLRCFAIGAGVDGKPVSNQQLADLSKLHLSTAGMNNVFFADAGLITKAGIGYVPVQEVISFERAYQFNPETAGQKLAPALRRSWFGQALIPKLSVSPLSEDAALGELAEACRAQPEHKPQLRTLLDWLVLGAVIERDGTMVRQGRLARDDGGQLPRSEDASLPGYTPATPPAPKGGVATNFAANAGSGAAGGLTLSVNIVVDMAEMGTWPPQVVTAFMAGLAQVITAKAAAEGSAAR